MFVGRETEMCYFVCYSFTFTKWKMLFDVPARPIKAPHILLKTVLSLGREAAVGSSGLMVSRPLITDSQATQAEQIQSLRTYMRYIIFGCVP